MLKYNLSKFMISLSFSMKELGRSLARADGRAASSLCAAWSQGIFAANHA